MHILNDLINIPSLDPDDARRGKLLNILLLGITCVLLFTLLGFLVIYIALGLQPWTRGMTITSFILLAGMLIIYFFNRKWTGKAARIIFLLFITLVFTFSDNRLEISEGRSLFIFTIPIVMASVLLEPASSLLFSALCSSIITIIALTIGETPNLPAIAGYFLVALTSWISAHDLQRALKEVRQTNAELDERVADRTRELSNSLARESQQASQRQAILQAIADGVMVIDTHGQVILANPAISHLINIPLDQIIAHHHTEIFESPLLNSAGRNALAQGMPSLGSGNAPARIPWGEKILSVSLAPVQDARGQNIGNVAVFRDFTREAEIDEMKNSFVAIVSHELRTPLNAILGYSEMLRDAYYGPLNEKQVNAADRILNNSRRLLDIVSDLLDKAQLEAGYLNLEIVPFQAVGLIDTLHGVMDKIIQDKGLVLVTEIAQDVPAQLTGDPQRIQQVLINLVNNAAKFTEKGSIQVKIYKVADEYWAFDVSDSGPGISPEDQKTIFEPFRQVGKTVTRGHKGIGLGLSIVKRLVNLMKGRIFVKSIVGQGSTFSVVLPFEPPQKGIEK